MKIVTAAPVAQASGKQGDALVYSLWRGVQYARTYTNPSNPNTANQQLSRAAFSQLTKAYPALTAQQRAGWDTYATNNKVRDTLGREVVGTSLGAYVALGSLNKLRGVAAVATAPTSAKPSALTSIALATAGEDTSLVVTVAHAYSTVTDLYLMVRYAIVPSVAVKPDVRRTSLVCGWTSNSIKALPANNGDATFTNIRSTAVDGTPLMVSACIVDQYGQAGPWSTIVTTAAVA